MNSEIWVVVEHRDGHLRRIALELVSEARRLADGMKGRVSAIALGADLACHAETLAHYGQTESPCCRIVALPLMKGNPMQRPSRT